MAKWVFEPGHTGAEFRVRHMMVTWVRGNFKDVHGFVEFDQDDPANSYVEANLKTEQIWTGESARDAHLRSSDFLEVQSFPEITFKSSHVARVSENEYKMTGDLTIRGVTKEVELYVRYLGHWRTPYWEEGQDRGPVTRTGFTAETAINRLDYGVLWNDDMENGGVVAGTDVIIRIDVEAILESDLARITQATRRTA